MLPWNAPIDPGDAGDILSFHGIAVGERGPDGALWVYNPSRVDVTLDSVSLAQRDAQGLKVVDAWLPVPTQRCINQAADPSNAPGACHRPMEGYRVPAGTPLGNGPRLVVVLEAERPGRYLSPGFVIHYHVGLLHYSTTYNNGLVLCTEGQGCPDSLVDQVRAG